MRFLTPNEAMEELEKANLLNPGPWREHSISVANNARLIASRAPGMNPDTAYVMGLLHDIGRRAGVTGILHVFDGYDYMMSLGQAEIARICLTHSFPLADIEAFLGGKFDCTAEQKTFLADYLRTVEYDDCDRLIQLCDAISLPNGACIIEKRLVDVTLRHGFSELTVAKWRTFMQTKKYFDERCGQNIYEFLPNILENSSVNLI